MSSNIQQKGYGIEPSRGLSFILFTTVIVAGLTHFRLEFGCFSSIIEKAKRLFQRNRKSTSSESPEQSQQNHNHDNGREAQTGRIVSITAFVMLFTMLILLNRVKGKLDENAIPTIFSLFFMSVQGIFLPVFIIFRSPTMKDYVKKLFLKILIPCFRG